jgi:uncharacterized protein (TIGR00251 family)
MLPLKETPHGITLSLQVIPRSRKCEIAGLVGDAIKVRLTAPPVEGKANEECLRFFADIFGIPRNRLSIVTGQSSRKKTLLVSGVEANALVPILSRLLSSGRTPELFDLTE